MISAFTKGFLDILRDMLGDSNPPASQCPRGSSHRSSGDLPTLRQRMVVANAVASLGEISTSARKNYLKLDEDRCSPLDP